MEKTKTPEEIKKRLERCKEGAHCNACASSLHCQIEEDALVYIQQLEAQVPKWISVEDRLPKPDKNVLTLKNRKRVRIGYYSEDCEEWVINNMVAYDECITHWMPLPEPPKEG